VAASTPGAGTSQERSDLEEFGPRLAALEAACADAMIPVFELLDAG
jgi:hypothetical protein